MGFRVDIRDQNDFDKLEAQNRTTSPGLLMSVAWKSSRVAQWLIEGGALPVNGEQTGSIN